MPRQTLAERLDAAATRYCDVRAAAMDKLRAAAMAYAKAETLAYSRAHPRRRVVFCAAMGSTDLTVSPGGTCAYLRDYVFNGADVCDIGTAPAFMVELARIDFETEDGRGWLAGPLRFECKGGRVVSDLTHW